MNLIPNHNKDCDRKAGTVVFPSQIEDTREVVGTSHLQCYTLSIRPGNIPILIQFLLVPFDGAPGARTKSTQDS